MESITLTTLKRGESEPSPRNPVIDGVSEILFAAQVAFRGLNGHMT